MRTILSVLVSLLAIGGLQHATVPPGGQPVESVLDRKEQKLEQLYATYWQIQYQLEKGDTNVSARAIEGNLRDVFNDPAFLEALKAAHFDDPVLARRRELFQEAAADSQISTDAELATIVESIRKDGSAIRYRVGGKSLDRPELDNVVGHSPDRELRRQAWYAQADLTKLTGDRIRQVMKLRNRLAPRYAGQKFNDFMLKRRATNRRDLSRWFEEIRTSTEPEYVALLARAKQQLQVEKVEPWDLEYYFSTMAPELEGKFGWEGGWEKTAKVASLLGFDFSRLPVDVEDYRHHLRRLHHAHLVWKRNKNACQ
jgi:oligoendopeptidase F